MTNQWLDVECPTCGARRGRVCRRPNGSVYRSTHIARFRSHVKAAVEAHFGVGVGDE